MKASFNNIKISAISAVVGDISVNIDDELMYYTNEKQVLRLKKSFGINTRCVVNDKITNYDLTKEAVSKLFNENKLKADDFDGIIYVTQTPDYLMPGNAHILHGDFGFKKECIALDIELGCSGFIYGLFIAFLLCNSGIGKKILLINGDTLSKTINVKNRIDAPIFGDCSCATVIEKCSDLNPTKFILNTDGQGFNLIYRKAGGFRYPSSDLTRKIKIDENGNEYSEEDFYMSGADVFTFTLNEQPKLLKNILEYAELSINDIDYFIFHQANKFIVDNIAKKCEIEDKKVPCDVFSLYGNQSGASIPCQICQEFSKTENKETIKVLLQGFGVGLSWGGCITEFKNLICSEPSKYIGDK